MATGRPRKPVNSEQFEEACNIQCTLQEIASLFRCSEDTIERWCKATYGLSFADAHKRFSAGGRMSLRRAQFKLAETNAQMAKWLGQQYLNQSDNPQLDEDSDTAQQITRLGELLWKGKQTYGAAAASSDAPEQQGEGPGSGSTPSADAAPPAVIKAKPAKGKAAPRKGVKSK